MTRQTKQDLEREVVAFDALLTYVLACNRGDVVERRAGSFCAIIAGLRRANGGVVRIQEDGCSWALPQPLPAWLDRMRARGGRLAADEVELLAAVEEAVRGGVP